MTCCQRQDRVELASLYAAPGPLRTSNVDALKPEQRQRRQRLIEFEDHFMDCQDCLQQVEAEVAIVEALEENTASVTRSGWPAWSLAMAATFLLAVPSAYLVGVRGGGGAEPGEIIVMSETFELFLDTARGSDQSYGTALPARIWLPASAVAPDSDSVAVSIIGADGEVVWEAPTCTLDSLGNVEIFLPLGSLPEGDYEVMLAKSETSIRYSLAIVVE